MESHSGPDQVIIFLSTSDTQHTQCRQVKKTQYILKSQYRLSITIQPNRESTIDHLPPDKWPDQVSYNSAHVVDLRLFAQGFIMARSTSRPASIDSYDSRGRHW